MGKWEISNETGTINYVILHFNSDSTAILSSYGDTLFRYSYLIMDDKLNFISMNNLVFSCPIILLSDNELILRDLFENKGDQIYKKAENDVNNY